MKPNFLLLLLTWCFLSMCSGYILMTGEKAVDKAIAKLSRLHQLRPEEQLFLKRVALVESKFGTLQPAGSFRKRLPIGGIWRVSFDDFRRTQITSQYQNHGIFLQVKLGVGIDWENVDYSELDFRPFLSALAAYLLVILESRSSALGQTLKDQALLWNRIMNKNRITPENETVIRFMETVKVFENQSDTVTVVANPITKDETLLLIVIGSSLGLFTIVVILLWALCPKQKCEELVTGEVVEETSTSGDGDQTVVGYYNLRLQEKQSNDGLHRGFISVVDCTTNRTLEKNCKVAVKTTSTRDLSTLERFRHERSILAQLQPSHHAVIRLFSSGYLQNNTKFCLVFEHCPGGNLLNFLENSRLECLYDVALSPPSLQLFNKLLDIVWQVADGMKFVHQHQIVHRCLQAKNIQMTGFQLNKVKISNFEYAEAIMVNDKEDDDGGYFQNDEHNERMPLFISAPESLAQQRFYLTSDVWSFGVLLWQILMLGTEPYADVIIGDDVDAVRSLLIDRFRHGETLQAPGWASDDLKGMLRDCFLFEHEKRLHFYEIVEKLFDEIIRNK